MHSTHDASDEEYSSVCLVKLLKIRWLDLQHSYISRECGNYGPHHAFTHCRMFSKNEFSKKRHSLFVKALLFASLLSSEFSFPRNSLESKVGTQVTNESAQKM
jgi:hypothetical protein